jgi:hypothetical protein
MSRAEAIEEAARAAAELLREYGGERETARADAILAALALAPREVAAERSEAEAEERGAAWVLDLVDADDEFTNGDLRLGCSTCDGEGTVGIEGDATGEDSEMCDDCSGSGNGRLMTAAEVCEEFRPDAPLASRLAPSPRGPVAETGEASEADWSHLPALGEYAPQTPAEASETARMLKGSIAAARATPPPESVPIVGGYYDYDGLLARVARLCSESEDKDDEQESQAESMGVETSATYHRGRRHAVRDIRLAVHALVPPPRTEPSAPSEADDDEQDVRTIRGRVPLSKARLRDIRRMVSAAVEADARMDLDPADSPGFAECVDLLRAYDDLRSLARIGPPPSSSPDVMRVAEAVRDKALEASGSGRCPCSFAPCPHDEVGGYIRDMNLSTIIRTATGGER